MEEYRTPGPDAAATADRRREDMVRAAVEVMAERGYTDTRIADVAERAGASPALVIYYFTTKDNLLAEAVRQAEDEWYDLGAARMAGIASAAGRLEWVVAATCLPDDDDDDVPTLWPLWLDLWAQSLRRPEVAKVRAEYDARWRATIAGIVVDGRRAGEFADVDPAEFAVTLSALLDGLALQVALDDPVVRPRTAFACAMSFASGRLGFPWSPPAGAGPA